MIFNKQNEIRLAELEKEKQKQLFEFILDMFEMAIDDNEDTDNIAAMGAFLDKRMQASMELQVQVLERLKNLENYIISRGANL